jgi:hypothetical protein
MHVTTKQLDAVLTDLNKILAALDERLKKLEEVKPAPKSAAK